MPQAARSRPLPAARGRPKSGLLIQDFTNKAGRAAKRATESPPHPKMKTTAPGEPPRPSPPAGTPNPTSGDRKPVFGDSAVKNQGRRPNKKNGARTDEPKTFGTTALTWRSFHLYTPSA